MIKPTTNFKDETYQLINGSGHTRDQVMFVGSRDGKYRMSMDKFDDLACSLNYDAGYGSQKIAADLIIYFTDNSYAERTEYDGCEWWEYKELLLHKDTDTFQDFSHFSGKRTWSTRVEDIQSQMEDQNSGLDVDTP